MNFKYWSMKLFFNIEESNRKYGSLFRINDHGKKFGHFINNKWVHHDGRKTYETTAPATGQVLASTVQGTADDVNQGLLFSPD